MKKNQKNLKSIKLNKKVISNFKKVKGGLRRDTMGYTQAIACGSIAC